MMLDEDAADTPRVPVAPSGKASSVPEAASCASGGVAAPAESVAIRQAVVAFATERAPYEPAAATCGRRGPPLENQRTAYRLDEAAMLPPDVSHTARAVRDRPAEPARGNGDAAITPPAKASLQERAANRLGGSAVEPPGVARGLPGAPRRRDAAAIALAGRPSAVLLPALGPADAALGCRRAAITTEAEAVRNGGRPFEGGYGPGRGAAGARTLEIRVRAGDVLVPGAGAPSPGPASGRNRARRDSWGTERWPEHSAD